MNDTSRYYFTRIIQVLVFLLFSLASNAHGHTSHIKYFANEKVHNEHKDPNSQTVYVCLGEYAYAYHSRSDCPGLSNCKGSINYTDENTASVNLSRVPCCRCWSNVSDRCKDDNPNHGGLGYDEDDTEIYRYVALAIVTASAAVLSNDLYFHPVYSNYETNQWTMTDGAGLVFGLRKTWDKTALEYGASVLIRETPFGDYERWGTHVNLVHNMFDNRTPEWLNLYFGPTLNYVDKYGYGGIAGAQFRLVDRLKFDIRYEVTTETNQVQAGLIFTYQKKYFWNR